MLTQKFWEVVAQTADVMTFFAFHLILHENLDICGGDDLFFAFHLILREQLNI